MKRQREKSGTQQWDVETFGETMRQGDSKRRDLRTCKSSRMTEREGEGDREGPN